MTIHGDEFPILPEALADSVAIRRLENLAASLPKFNGAFLECRLGSDTEALVGFAVALRQPAEGWSLGDRWPAFRPFLNVWQGLDRQLDESVTHIGLEFDLDAANSELATPSLFASLHRSLPQDEQRKLVPIFARLLDCSEAQIDDAARILSLLPGQAKVFCVGCMVSRRPRVLRLNLGGLDAEAILELLTALGWNWGESEFGRRLRAISAWSHDLVLVLDALPGVDPDHRHFGVECFQADGDGSDWWRGGLDWLSDAGLCLASRREVLQHWPGSFSCALPVPSWLDLLHSSPRTVRLLRTINHYKLTCRQGGHWDAKAYLAYFREEKPCAAPSRPD